MSTNVYISVNPAVSAWSLMQLDVVNDEASIPSLIHMDRYSIGMEMWILTYIGAVRSRTNVMVHSLRLQWFKRLANLLATTLRCNVTDASCAHTRSVQCSPYPPSLVHGGADVFGVLCSCFSFLFFHICRRADAWLPVISPFSPSLFGDVTGQHSVEGSYSGPKHSLRVR